VAPNPAGLAEPNPGSATATVSERPRAARTSFQRCDVSGTPWTNTIGMGVLSSDAVVESTERTRKIMARASINEGGAS
jgi:hypothetical protein